MPFLRIIVCLLVLITGLQSTALAQTPAMQTATSVSRTDPGCVLIICGSISRAGNAADTDPNTAARISPPLALGQAVLGLRFESAAPVGTSAALLLSSGSDLLDVGVLSNINVSTYLGKSRTARQTMALSSLLTVNVLSTTAALVQFPVQQTFDQVEISVGGVVSLSYSLRVHEAYAASAVAPLPVTLTHFKARPAAGGVELSWATAQELNNEAFVVERSADGQQFEELSRVAGAGSTAQTQRYTYLDARPLSLAYYRLRQLDHDGRATWSSIITVQANAASELAVFPVPAGTQITISGPAGIPFQIINQLGQAVRVGTVGGDPVSLAELPAGVYIVRNEATGRNTRFLKQ
ncbi:T9SS type A sorting domain-containing protein [Hymenobacter rigui]|uniref:T9SS C-terminal target domain-containing protein n=1 Tax=Hymenobacter rigui TaxID=334424 RepID=A0A428KWQ9_9BACT|nr:T9SS type A sorting domain-containing protein [Hymenobacter rigui]RSK51138.1 T9SS C-terminal target domain-containing protein [Hymenobacter rigui]